MNINVVKIFLTDTLSLHEKRSGTKLKISLRDIFAKCRRFPRVCAESFLQHIWTPIVSNSLFLLGGRGGIVVLYVNLSIDIVRGGLRVLVMKLR